MILADTSVWVEHFRRGHAELSRQLEAGEVAIHGMIAGELACGNLPRRERTLALLLALPRIATADDEQVLHAIDLRRWSGQGIGWVDAHLLTAALISGTPLWTLERRLHRLARTLGIAALQ